MSQLAEISEALAGRRLIVVSDSSPIEYTLDSNNLPQPRRGRSGLAAALRPLAKLENASWIVSARDDVERWVAKRTKGKMVPFPLAGHQAKMRFLTPSGKTHEEFQSVLCHLLWSLQHHLSSGRFAPRGDNRIDKSWDKTYLPMNQMFAKAVLQAIDKKREPPLFFVQNHQFYLLPSLIRQKIPNALIEHFVHIPWPSHIFWQFLPDRLRSVILESLISANIVGLQTSRDVNNFLDCCQNFLPDVEVTHRSGVVTYRDHVTHVRAYPTSIDMEDARNVSNSPEVTRHEQHLLSLYGQNNRKIIVRVDRKDPSKNIPAGFRAFSKLLEQRPDLLGKVVFLAFLSTPDANLPDYERCHEEIDHEVQTVNQRFGRSNWRPVTVFYQHSHHHAVAGLRLYDVLLVNSLMEGMNLVAKEGPVVNTRDGVTVLSETVGACHQLREGVLSVDPTDEEGTAAAMHAALIMPKKERKHRISIMNASVEQDNSAHWFINQIRDFRTYA